MAPAKKEKETSEKTEGKESQENEEEGKKEKFLEIEETKPSKKAQKKQEGIPAYLLALVLILGILIGIAAIIAIQPKTPETIIDDKNTSIEPTNDLQFKTVPITMVYSKNCKSCRQTNTIEELFQVRNIAYSMKKVDAESDEGKQIIERFSIESVPTAIIDAKKMEFYPTTKKNFDNISLIKKENSAYIVPELNLNDKFYFPLYYLEKKSEYCSQGKTAIAQFDDYYTPTNIMGLSELYKFAEDFNTATEMKFVFAQSVSRDENAMLANLFLMCASQQGKYIELQKTITGFYCNNPFKGDETILTQPEINGCTSLSNHYGTPLTQIELDVALGRVPDLNIDTFKQCISDKNVLYNNAEKAVKELNIQRTGTFLIDCQETTNLAQLRESFCTMHPEIGGKCQEKAVSNETTT